jgi:ribonuclease D
VVRRPKKQVLLVTISPSPYDLKLAPANQSGSLTAAELSPAAYKLIRDAPALAELAAGLEAEPQPLAVDLETTALDPRNGRIRLCQVATADGRCWVTDGYAVDLRPLVALLQRKSWMAHNALFELSWLIHHYGFEPGAPVYDTMILSQLLAAGTRAGNSLQVVAKRELGLAMDKSLQADGWDTATLTEEQLRYAATDALVLQWLYPVLTAKIASACLQEIAELERRALPCVAWMANKGVAFDLPKWLTLAEREAAKAENLAEKLTSLAPANPGGMPKGAPPGVPWNWNSPVQVKRILQLAGHEVPGTSDEVLAGIDHEIARTLRQYRSAVKMCTTYGTRVNALQANQFYTGP